MVYSIKEMKEFLANAKKEGANIIFVETLLHDSEVRKYFKQYVKSNKFVIDGNINDEIDEFIRQYEHLIDVDYRDTVATYIQQNFYKKVW